VTSSSTISAGACTGLGFAPTRVGEIFGIFKAYCTRVGSGPFPTELNDKDGERMRNKGAEFGSTTGRPRRCGWLDLPALRYAIMINGTTRLFMTKADVLSGFDKIKICTSYNISGSKLNEIPSVFSEKPEPTYTELRGWKEDISAIREFDQLPDTLKEFINFIEDHTHVPITMVSVGPDRIQTIFRQ